MEHNRYLIYELLGKQVEAELPLHLGGGKASGIADKVCRNIFDETIEMVIAGQHYSFREPSVIYREDSQTIVLAYGDLEEPAASFESVDGYHESVNAYFSRTDARPVYKVVFKYGKQMKTPGKRWRDRVAV